MIKIFLWLKGILKYLLISILGFSNFLYVVAIFRIYTIKLNRHERDFLYFISLIPQNSTVLDIGANIGYKTYHFSHIKATEVHAFEPITENADILKKIVSRFNLRNVVIHDYAIGNINSNIKMVMPIIGHARAHAYCYVPQEKMPSYKDSVEYDVPIKKIDDIEYFVHASKPVSAIKIDVENYEYFVLEGGAGTLKKYHPIIYCEVWHENKERVFDFIKNLDYKIYKYHDGKLLELTQKNDEVASVNYFFIHKNNLI
jgi:FkbM family methyltransferase